ncbi:MAG TPA: hypothetical protein VMG10_15325 [Gemmataceae bacterium]|nr:hypothetical protein [Gemmataceae bacterium]
MRRRAFDFVLMAVVLVFAFLASSFAVRNSDFWLHRASGRLLAEGRYQIGVDPFAFTTESRYWANHAWLFDLLLFLFCEHFSGGLLVVLKALLVSLLAVVLLRVRRPDSGLGWPAACTLLAVLAMSPRLLLHSTCLSYVLLGLTLWLLWRPRPSSAAFRRRLLHDAPVLLVFVLWVNLDDWFLLGPLLASLFWLGERLSPGRNTGDEMPRTPVWLWTAGLAVCLVNPHHFHAFTLPMELMPLPDALRHDVRFQPLHAAPWRMGLYYHPLAGINWANSAYLVLLVGGVLSFLLNARSLLGWRLLIWLTFAGLSAWRGRTIPFFVVVAAPITALNLQDAFGASSVSEGLLTPRLRCWLRATSSFTLVISSLVLIVLAWPGWLQGFQDIGRHVDWTVQPDGSLRRVAEKLRHWHRNGKLPAGSRGFLSHWAVVHYCAWFCPEEKGFLDPRLSLFRDVASEYEQICRALNLGLDREDRQPAGDCRALLRARGITHLVLYDSSLPRLAPALGQLAGAEGDWTLLDIDGLTLIAGWRDGARALPEGVPPFDGECLAFTTATEGEDETMVPAPPAPGPEHGPRPDDFWSPFGEAVAPSPWQTETAGVLLYYFEAGKPQRRLRHESAWSAALPGLPALSVGSLDGLFRLAVRIEQAQQGQRQPPALPLLAVRAARSALAQNPDDANAYLHLGRAYLDLAERTPERGVIGWLPPLFEMRHIQFAAALENALSRNPDSLPVHEELAELYGRRGFLDAALEHRRAALRLVRRAGAIPGENPAAFARRVEPRERAVKELERVVSDQKNAFALQTRNLGSEPRRKAEIALGLGLARLALQDVLMPSSMVLLGGEGIVLQVRLQMMLGQIDSIRTQLQEPSWKAHKANLGFVDLTKGADSRTTQAYNLPAYDWLLLCQAAAFGDYEQADAALHDLVEGFGGERAAERARKYQRSLLVLTASELGWLSQPQPWVMSGWTAQERLLQTVILDRLTRDVIRQADLHVLAGMLALERGRPLDAEKAFRTALALSRLGSGTRHASAGHPLAEAYVRLIEKVRR